jgi:hypothetical protein
MVGAGTDPAADAAALAADRPTLARHRHRALLRLVRPAEAAARRLIIALALAAPAAPAEAEDAGRPARAAPAAAADAGEARPEPAAAPAPPVAPGRARRLHPPLQPKTSPAILRTGIGTGIVLPAELRLAARAGAPETPPRVLRLPLTDPVRRLRVWRVAARDLPRISVPGRVEPFRPPLRPAPAPDDRLDATRLVLRLRALADALDHLPREARRFARWQARNRAAVARCRAAEVAPFRAAAAAPGRNPAAAGAARRYRRVSPLRSGRPPGGRRKPAHEIHAILHDIHGIAFDLLARRDTS